MIPVWVIALLAALGAVCLALPLHIGMTGVCLLLLAADFEEKERTEALEPSSDRSDCRRHGGDFRCDGVYCRAGTGQHHGTGRNAGVYRRTRRAGAGRWAVADVKKAAGQDAHFHAGTPG